MVLNAIKNKFDSQENFTDGFKYETKASSSTFDKIKII